MCDTAGGPGHAVKSAPAGIWGWSPRKIFEISTILNAQKLPFPSYHGGQILNKIHKNHIL